MTLFFSDILELIYYMTVSFFNNSLFGLFLMFIILNFIIWAVKSLLFR